MATKAELAIIIKATDEASSVMKGVSKEMSGVASAAASAAKVLAGAVVVGAGAAAAGMAYAATQAAGFEKTLSAISAVSGATAKEMDGLSSLALQLGKDTQFSASEAAAGMEELIKGGVSVEDVLNGAAKATLNLAAAGGTDLVSAAEIASNALNTFNLSGAEMAHVADLIAGAANASAIGVSDFKLSLAAVGAVSNTVGMTIDDTAVAIAALGNAGIKGSDAGTSLKTMLLNLQPTTKDQIQLFKDLNLITREGANQFFDATGKVKGFGDVSQVLQTALGDMTDQQRLATLEMMFGSDAIRAAAVFAEAGAAGFDELAASMSKVTAEAVAAERLNNLAGDMEQLKGSIETAAITFGLALLPSLRDVAKAATEFVNSLIPLIEQYGPAISDWLTNTAAPAIRGFVQAFLDAIPQVQAFLASLQPVVDFVSANLSPILTGLAVAILAVVVPAFAAWAISAVAAAAATVVALAPVLIPVAAIALAVAALKAAWDSNFGDIQGKTAAVWAAVEPILQAVFTELSRFWTEIQPLLAAAWAAISARVTEAMGTINTIIQTVLPPIVEFWRTNWDSVLAILSGILSLIQIAIETWWAVVSGIIKVGLMVLAGDWSGAWTEMLAVLSAITDGVERAMTTMLDIISAAWAIAWSAMSTSVGLIWSGIKTTVAQGVNGVIQSLNTLIGAWNALSFEFPKIDIPIPKVEIDIPGILGGGSISVGGGSINFGGTRIDTPDAALLPLIALAKGGIVTSPTMALIGESGPEAVVPLNRASGLGMTVNVTIQNHGAIGVRDLGDLIVSEITKAQRRGRLALA